MILTPLAVRSCLASVGTIALCVVAAGALEGRNARETVLVRAAKPYDATIARIVQAGGTVTHAFRKIDAIAAEVPETGLATLRAALPAGAISKDEEMAAPGVHETAERPLQAEEAELAGGDVAALDAAALALLAAEQPQAYGPNNGITNVSVLHGAGIAGQGMVVGVIDSGIRPGFPHLSLDGSVIGCEDFVLDALGCSHFSNSGHGTFVAGMVSANVSFSFGAASVLRRAVELHLPSAFSNPPTNTQIPMIGAAPLSSIYALRVFGPTGGAPTSRILQAMERAIELREQFDAGLGGQDVGVVNMSLGGSTLFAGRDLFDRMVDAMLAADILPVIAAGNSGPALLTTGSPGSALSALTVGAASLAHNERILRHLQLASFFGDAAGASYRPFAGHQTAYFSSRGPNADGRLDPDVVATGFANYGQGTGSTVNSISIGSGTSYASPVVAGIAAVLRQAVPGATAIQVRNALIAGANPAVLTDGSSDLDQGGGMVDALAAYTLLANGAASSSLEKPHRPKKKVEKNVTKFAGLDVHSGNVSLHSGPLRPGQARSILYNVPDDTAQLLISIANFQQTGPGNVIFGDDILLAVHTAKTSLIGGGGDYPILTFTTGGSFVVTDPEPGLARVTLYGDWTNTDVVSVDATVSAVSGPAPRHSASGNLRNGDFDQFVTSVPPGVSSLEFHLEWQEDWSRYPTTDLDLLLVTPSNALVTAGATLRSPERVTIANPAAGNWTVLVDAFEVHLNKANYKLTMIRDGVTVRLK